MRSLIYLSFLGWLCLISWSLFVWWQADFSAADKKLNALLRSQAKVLPNIKLLSKKEVKISPIGLIPLKLGHIEHAPRLNSFISDAIGKSIQFWRLISVATQCMLIKLLLLVMAIPLLSITTLVGVVDGLSQRAIRTACLGRESSYLFHQLKRYSQKGLSIFLGCWLVLPLSITPALVFIPMSLFTGIITAITVSHFKKYY